MLKKLLFSFVVLSLSASVFAAKNRPDGYVTICKIGETCSVSSSTNVAFGAADLFVYKVLSGSFSCSVATFGSDPNPNKSVKECSIPTGSSGGGGNSSSSSSSDSGGGSSDVSLGTSAGNGSVSLNWSTSANINAIEIYRDTDSNPSGRVRIASLSGSARSYTATGLSNGTTYWFWVKYRLSDNNWYNSNAASGTPTGSSGGGSSSSSGGGSGGITGASCSANGSTTVNSTIRVTSGTYDGSCRVHNGGGDLGDGSQDEGQDPIFRVENGATLRNVIIGNNGADGIHVYNSGNVDNVTWQNVGEDALTIKSSGTVNVTNIEGYDAGDKFFQVNAASTLRVSNCIIRNAGKALRQNGGTTYKIDVAFDRCDLSGLNEGVFRTDSSSSVARITNSRLESGTTICIGFSSGNCSSSGITYY